jgi:predicted glycoside hydrolase/deacetylase ChbG (UPF0249 family)
MPSFVHSQSDPARYSAGAATEGPRLVITCDDLGYHPTINEAIVDVLSDGIVRSASIMSAAPHFDDAVRRLAAAGIDRVGLHLTLAAEYRRLPIRPVSDARAVASLVDAAGRFHRDLAAARDRFVLAEVDVELCAQIERARRAGLCVTHLDGHLFWYEPEVGGPRLLAVAEEVARRYGLPLRRRSAPRGGAGAPTYMFWSPSTTAERFRSYAAFFASYAAPLAELIIHPGKDLTALATFSSTGERRVADYRYFRSGAFRDAVHARDLRVVGWADS